VCNYYEDFVTYKILPIMELIVEVSSQPEEDLSSQHGSKKMAFGRLSSTQFCVGQGEVIESDDIIILEGVPIITPNRDIVVPSLSFEVRIVTVECIY